MNRITYILLVALFAFIPEYIYSADLWVEAEGFDNKGGWVVDQQFMDQMGSSYLMAVVWSIGGIAC